MTELKPFSILRNRKVGDKHIIGNPAGRFFRSERGFFERYEEDNLSNREIDFLHNRHYLANSPLAKNASIFANTKRNTSVSSLEYLILVPTLRCNLACSYCQVSRANEDAAGYDWDDATLRHIKRLIERFSGRALKIEFQGGEPTLRPDLIEAVLEAGSHIPELTAVVCTNLQKLDESTLSIFDREAVQISTSLDGSSFTHKSQRTQSEESTRQFQNNLNFLLERYGPGKISALPTVDPVNPPEIDEFVEAFTELGFSSIYLRPINYQGFARKRHPASFEQSGKWQTYYNKFIHRLIARNWIHRDQIVEETYFSHCLSRIFRPGLDRHVDLRSPNPIGVDYVVVDYDGKVYPTDEARMLTRSAVLDLSIGDVSTGWNTPERQALHDVSTNAEDPDCQKCIYQPFCGRDIIDDISRYGRIDVPRHETNFCRRHIGIFDLAFSLIYSEDEAVQFSLRRWLGLGSDQVVLGETV